MRKFNDPIKNYFFVSDLHIGHANIIKHDKQSYRDFYERDAAIIENWNKIVSPNDDVFNLGDVGFNKDFGYIREIFSQLNGNILSIKGNHDSRDQIRLYEEVGEYLGPQIDVIVMKQQIALCHYRMDSWRNSHRGSWHLHGHHHCSHKNNPNKMIYDVGIMGNDMKPLEFSKIKTIMSKKDYVKEYHH